MMASEDGDSADRRDRSDKTLRSSVSVWLLRALALACLPLAGLAGFDAAMAYFATRVPEVVPMALRARPEMRITAAEQHSTDPAWIARNRAMVAADARRALVESPLNSAALRQLAMAREAEKPGSGASTFALADRVTRRDLLVQQHLIGSLSQAGDLAGALRHFDIDLRLAPGGEAPLYAAIAPQLQYAPVQQALAPYAGRAWMRGLLQQTRTLGVSLETRAALADRMLPGMAPADARRIGLDLAAALAGAGDIGRARGLMARIPGLGRGLLGEYGFTPGSTDPQGQPFAWKLNADERVDTALQPPRGLRVTVSAALGGLVASRSLLLTPGNWRMRFDLRADASAPMPQLSASLRCPDGRDLVPDGQRAGLQPGRSELTIAVPAGCAIQNLLLTASPAESQLGSVLEVAMVDLVPE